jgi:multiple sugar transport system substrate-binding protein
LNNQPIMRKLPILTILVLSLALLLVASPVSAQEVKVIFSSWGNQDEADMNQRIIDAFNAANPDIEAEFLHIPSEYEDRIMTMYAAGIAPDVQYTSPFAAYDLYEAGLVANLQPYFEREPQWLDPSRYFTRAFIPYTDREGNIFATVSGSNVWGIFYNIEQFEQMGLEDPHAMAESGRWSWDDYIDSARLLTRDLNADGEPNIYGTAGASSSRYWGSLVGQNGGRLFDDDFTRTLLDQPEAIEALEFLQALHWTHGVAPAAYPWGHAAMFLEGNLAMLPQQSHVVQSWSGNAEFRWGMAPLPSKVQQMTAISGGAFRVSSQSEHPEAAWRLASFFMGPEAQSIIGESGLITPFDRNIALADSFINIPGGPENHIVRLEAVEHSEPMEFQHVRGPAINNVFAAEIGAMLRNEMSAANAARRIADQVNGILREYRGE